MPHSTQNGPTPETVEHLLERIAELEAEIAEREHSEKALRASEEKYRTLFDSIDEGFYLAQIVWDDAGKAVDIFYLDENPAAVRTIGQSAKGRLMSELDPNYEQYWRDTFGHTAKTGEAQRLENYAAPNQIWFSFYVFKPAGIKDDRTFAVIFQDVTPRKCAEEALRESEERLRRVLDGMGEGFGLLAPDFTILEHNREALRMDGRSREEIVGRSHWEVYPESESSELGLLLKKAMSERVPVSLEHLYAWDEGRALWLGMRAYPTEDGSLAVFWRDVTDQRNAQDALRESEEKYRSIFENIDEGFGIQEVITDENGNVTDVIYREGNGAFARLTGMKDVVGKKVSEFLPHLEQAWLDALTQVHKTGKPLRTEDYSADLNRWFSYYYSRIGEAGSPLIAVVFNDITERKERERQQEFLLKLADALRPLSDPHQIQQAATQVLGEYLGVDRAYYVDIEPDHEHWVVADNYVREGVPPLIGRGRVDDFGWAGKELLAGRTLRIADADNDPNLSASARAECRAVGLAALLAVPLIKEGRWLASFGLQHLTPRKWTEAETKLLEEAAERTWAAIERAKAEAALRESELRFKLMADTLPQSIWVTDPHGNVEFLNKHWYDYSGMTEGTETAASIAARAIHPDDAPKVSTAFAESLQTGREFEIEQRNRAANGEYRWFLNRGTPYRDPNTGEILKWFGVGVDIHDRKMAEMALAESESRLRLVQAAGGIGGFDYDLKEDRAVCSPEYYSMFGMPDGSPVDSETWPQIIHPDDRERILGLFTDAIKHGRTVSYEFRIVRPDNGETRWISGRAAVLLTDEGRPWRLIGGNVDVTERKMSEARAAYRAALGTRLMGLETPAEVMGVFGEETNRLIGASVCAFIEIDESMNEATVTADWHREGRHSLLGTFDLRQYLTAEFQETMASGRPVIVRDVRDDSRIKDPAKMGELNIGSFVNVPVLRHGKWEFSIGVYHEHPYAWPDSEVDLMLEAADRIWTHIERARAEQALRESEEKYRTLFDSMDEGYCIIEMIFDDAGNPVDYRFLEVNAAFERQAGMTDVVGKRMLEFVTEIESHWLENYGWVARTGRPVRFANEYKGLNKWFDVYAFRPRSWNDSRIAVLFMDITDRKVAENQLREARDELEVRVQERTQELAQTNEILSVEIEERKELEKARVELVQRVVTTQEEERRRISRNLHDQLGQRLTALRLNLSALRSAVSNDGEVAPLVQRLVEIADTLDNEVSFLSSELRPTALDDLGLEEALKAYCAEWSRHFDLPLDFHSNFGAKTRVANEIETHLYRIAQEALNNIAKHAKATHVAVLLEKTADGVVLVLEDNGVGFDPQKAEPSEPGHGLGLVGMRERANLIGGDIEVESEAGRGSTIYVKVKERAD